MKPAECAAIVDGWSDEIKSRIDRLCVDVAALVESFDRDERTRVLACLESLGLTLVEEFLSSTISGKQMQLKALQDVATRSVFVRDMLAARGLQPLIRGDS